MMETIPVVLANRDLSLLQEMAAGLNQTADICVAATAITGKDALAALAESGARVLVTDFQLAQGDVFGLLRTLPRSGVRVVLCSQYVISPMVVRAMSMGCAAFVEFPCDWEAVADVVRAAVHTTLAQAARSAYMEARVERLLLSLGLTPERKGFRCMKLAVLLWMEEGEQHAGMTKWIYPAVAAQTGMRTAAVERCLRQTIAKLWSEPVTPARRRIFSQDWAQKCPTNGQFVAVLGLYLARPWGEIRE